MGARPERCRRERAYAERGRRHCHDLVACDWPERHVARRSAGGGQRRGSEQRAASTRPACHVRAYPPSATPVVLPPARARPRAGSHARALFIVLASGACFWVPSCSSCSWAEASSGEGLRNAREAARCSLSMFPLPSKRITLLLPQDLRVLTDWPPPDPASRSFSEVEAAIAEDYAALGEPELRAPSCIGADGTEERVCDACCCNTTTAS